MKQPDLFQQPEELPQAFHAGTGHYCRECLHCVRPHQYRQEWCYCSIQPSRRTQFGIQKIRALLPACNKFFKL